MKLESGRLQVSVVPAWLVPSFKRGAQAWKNVRPASVKQQPRKLDTVHFLIVYTLGSQLSPIHYKKYSIVKCSHADGVDQLESQCIHCDIMLLIRLHVSVEV